MPKKDQFSVKNTVFLHHLLRLVFTIILLLPIYIVLYKIYMPKIYAFGCFDDCFNFIGGYFLGKGKQLYSEIYFNHMPLMAFLSNGIQKIGRPTNIYVLILQHRQFLLVFSFIFNVLICWRFGIVGFLFTLIYEFSKFYVFGDRFLAESFTVYPLVYLAGIGLRTLQKKYVAGFEILLAAIFTWFVIFMREPYVLIALVLYILVLFPRFSKKTGLISIGLFIALTVGLFFFIPFRDFFYNVITLNVNQRLQSELIANNFIGIGFFKSFFYPIYLLILFAGSWNDFRIQLISLSVLLVTSLLLWITIKQERKVPLFLILFLGLANLRPTIPGLQYYEAFHMMNWYGLFIFTTMYLFYEAMLLVNMRYIFYILGIILVSYILFSSRSFIYTHKIKQQTEFLTNYGRYLQVGEVIKALSTPKQTLFTDGADEFLYWVSERKSAYPYSFFYVSPYDKYNKYYEARMRMFSENPPDIYYDFCNPEAPTHPSMPQQFLHLYTQVYSEQKPTCLYVKNTIVPGISPDQLRKAGELLYYLPK